MKKVYVISKDKLDYDIIIPKKYRNQSRLVIRTSEATGVFYYKKNSLQYTALHYFNSKNKSKVKEGYMMINGELCKIVKKDDKTGV